jgi:D-alanyl-D-alanine carboxypeptidase
MNVARLSGAALPYMVQSYFARLNNTEMTGDMQMNDGSGEHRTARASAIAGRSALGPFAKRFRAIQGRAWWCALLLIALIVPASGRKGEGEPALPLLTERFQSELDRFQKAGAFPGATAAFILADGRYAVCAAGYADKEQKVPMKADSRMLSGSVGKTFAAAVALSLAQEGKVGLDDKIEKWLGGEDWFSRLPNGKDITLRMLLTHSSGLTDHVNDLGFGLAVLQRTRSATPDPDFHFKPRELVEFVLDKKPLFPAGQGYSYTDTGYILVGMIIERAAGSTYYAELQKRFLDPLKLTLTVPANTRDIPGLSPGYMSPSNPLGLPAKTVADGKMLFNPANEWTGGGLATNPGDLVRWAKALYEGKAMPKPYRDDLLKSVPCDKSGKTRYGAGVVIQESGLGKIYGHDGWFPGYRTILVYLPARKVAIAMQTNTDVNQNMGKYLLALAKIVVP